mmetsp:Transcript_15671/g.40201  ORF Transcript_15671/g.40201 Transcript_15671/m.40201 type:complete len:162 (+) Transcript_15671:81-566(+)
MPHSPVHAPTPTQMAADPHQPLPRDSTGSYLHLKLKRFASPSELRTSYARQTWRRTPHDAEADVAPSARSKCRQCHGVIEKGDLRVRLWLQCHEGCKNSAYFHGACFGEYPEAGKVESAGEIVGMEQLPDEERKILEGIFEERKRAVEGDNSRTKKRSRRT